MEANKSTDPRMKALKSCGNTERVIGWREWVRLPDFSSSLIKAKIDTGARTSAIHAEDIVIFKRKGKRKVRFRLYPVQHSREKTVLVEADLLEKRTVRSSVGHETRRPVIVVRLSIGEYHFPIELTLVNRDIMGFRMLIGRQAIRKLFLIDPGKSFLVGKGKKRKKQNLSKIK
ncbi:MAG: ATP-dependent zinc protease [Bdellovibrionales bacterium]|nr:ATP-dependent zinc protease [Bdellovibrionales bacterium]